MKTKLFDVEDVLENEPVVFLDANVVHPACNWFTQSAYGKDSFSEIDSAALWDVAVHYAGMSSLFRHASLRSSDAIVRELYHFSEIIQHKIHYLKDADKNRLRPELLNSLTAKESHDAFVGLGKAYRTMVQGFQSLTHTLDDDYLAIEQGVRHTLEGLLVPVPFGNCGTKTWKRTHATYGDEGLMAAAIYTAGVKGEPCAIVSYDCDIPMYFAKALCAFPDIERRVKNIPLRIYWGPDKEVHVLTDIYDSTRGFSGSVRKEKKRLLQQVR